MSRVLYYGLIVPISYLPFRVLYILSDALGWLLYYVIRYRKKLILQNLAICFPGLSTSEIKQICRKHYRHFADHLFESIKAFRLSENEAVKRFRICNPELINGHAEKNENVVICTGHYTNFELGAVSTCHAMCNHLIIRYLYATFE